MKVSYRRTWRQILPTAGFALVGIALLLGRGVPGPGEVLVAVAGAVGGAMGMRAGGIDLTPEEVHVLTLGRRRIPWSAVTAVERISGRGGKGVRLVLAEGRPVTLQAPIHFDVVSPDPDFDEKAATIERYWRSAREGL